MPLTYTHTYTCTHTGILAVMIELVCSLHTAYYEWEESDMQLRMQLFSYISSLCAQDSHNCKSVHPHYIVTLN